MSARFVLVKVLGSLATLAFVVAFNFFLFRIVEGDPVANLFRGRNLTLEQRQELREQFGLDGSTLEQFGRYVQQTAQLNLGRSYTSNEPVIETIWERAWPTIALVGVSTLLSTVLGVLIGIAAAWKRGSPTHRSSKFKAFTWHQQFGADCAKVSGCGTSSYAHRPSICVLTAQAICCRGFRIQAAPTKETPSSCRLIEQR